MFSTQRLSILLGAVSVAVTLSGFSAPVHAISNFAGPYDPANWTEGIAGSNGSVDTGSAPASITLNGGNNGSNTSGSLSYNIISAPATGTVSFAWSYSITDNPNNGLFGYTVDSSFTQLSNNGGSPQNGTASFSVSAGQSFGFTIFPANNNGGGSATATISNFDAPIPVPLESDALPVVGATLFMAGGIWWKRKRQQAKVSEFIEKK